MKLLLLLIAPLAFAQDDAGAVRKLVDQYAAARDRIDAKAIAALFTEDADQLVSSGQWRRGRDEVVKGTVASSQSETGKRTIAVETMRFLSPDIAIADGHYDIGDRHMWTSIIAKRTPQGWRIAAIRNMLPAR